MNYSNEDAGSVGFIGAGKVGCTLGKFFAVHGVRISGYYSRTETSAREAAEFTGSVFFSSMKALSARSDLIFLTVPDGEIRHVYETLSDEASAELAGKYLFHCSGALSSRSAFPGIDVSGASGASVHPIFPVSGRFTVYQELQEAYFCLEGDASAVSAAEVLLDHCGVHFQRINPADKTKYHAGCVFASNLVCALMQESFDLLSACGFTQEGARAALQPLIMSNLNHVLQDGTVQALTGPVERCDSGTVEKHLSVLSGDTLQAYQVLSRTLVRIAQEKHPETDYTCLLNRLEAGNEGDR